MFSILVYLNECSLGVLVYVTKLLIFFCTLANNDTLIYAFFVFMLSLINHIGIVLYHIITVLVVYFSESFAGQESLVLQPSNGSGDLSPEDENSSSPPVILHQGLQSLMSQDSTAGDGIKNNHISVCLVFALMS